VGVGVSVILHIVRQSNQVSIRRRELDADGHLIETDPPSVLPAGEVVVLQPYGSLFFAAAPVFESALPAVTDASRNSVVILRLRGRTDLGTTFMDVLLRYAHSLVAADSRLLIVSTNDRIDEQLAVTGITTVIGHDSIYAGNERVGASVARAQEDAVAWIQAQRRSEGDSG
jgi:SulP family sulfate permease